MRRLVALEAGVPFRYFKPSLGPNEPIPPYSQYSVLTKKQLLASVAPREKVYVVDTMAKKAGIEVVRLPPYHCEFNPIEPVCEPDGNQEPLGIDDNDPDEDSVYTDAAGESGGADDCDCDDHHCCHHDGDGDDDDDGGAGTGFGESSKTASDAVKGSTSVPLRPRGHEREAKVPQGHVAHSDRARGS